MAVTNVASKSGNQAAGAKPARREISQNYQDFLKLLTTQLKNQSPTDPTDSGQITQQIATLSQVEQQITTNKNLKTLISLFNTTQYNSVVAYIGKQIEAAGDVGALQNGKAPFVYTLEREASSVEVTITNKDGTVIVKKAGSTVAGRNEYVWDGKDKNGKAMEDGTYKIKIKALDGSKNEIKSATYVTGVVTSIDSAKGTVYLSFGDISVPVDKVISIRQPSTTNS